MTDRAFDFREIAGLSGASPRQIDNWCRTDVLPASIRAGHGSGDSREWGRRWSFDDVLAAAVLALLDLPSYDRFRSKGLALAIHMHREVYGDYDCWLLIQGQLEPELVPSAEALIAIAGAQAAHASPLFTFVPVGAIADRILKEIAHGEAAVR